MLHQFPRTFALPLKGGHRLPDVAVLAPLTPAAYLRLRREAAGLSIDQVAARLAANFVSVAGPADPADDKRIARALIDMIEKPGSLARRDDTLDALRAVFAFDPDVYRQLATEPADRHPRVCRGCGCSQWDACDEDGQGCSWVTHGQCSRCLRADAAQAEQAQ